MQVVKEVTEKTLDGEVTTYMLRAGADPNKTVNIGEIDGEIFDSADNARRVLVERVTQAIAARVEQAVSKAKEWYPSGFEHASDDPLSLIKKTVLVTGEQAAAPAPKRKNGNGGAPAKPAPRAETTELAAELAAEAEAAVIELPDGTKAKVKSVKLPPNLS
jgi:hypothetical protein